MELILLQEQPAHTHLFQKQESHAKRVPLEKSANFNQTNLYNVLRAISVMLTTFLSANLV
jgi:hypothetical protein